MGVRGLETFLEKYCGDACYKVDIGKLVSDFKCKTGEPAIIVVDAQSCYKFWYQGLNWLVGFEIQEFIFRIRSFVEGFKKLGVRLIFFFGGLTPEKKRKAWLLRRRKNIEDIHIVFDILKEKRPLPEHFNSIPPNMGIITSYILKYVLGCEVYMSFEECDEEIIDYAQKHNCFAIFGQDSDFTVSQIDAVILSSKNFNLRTMTTVCYDRVKLAHYLKIRCDELPLLAILAGNDLVPFYTIQKFHQHLCGSKSDRLVPFHILMPAIGRYINALPKDIPSEKILERIGADLFDSTSYDLDLLKSCYDSYFVESTTAKYASPENAWSGILRIARYRHKNTMVPNTLYSILSQQIFECSTVLEDLRTTHDGNVFARNQPSATVLRPLRLRLYGILLFEYEQPQVQEWCGENVNSYSKPVLVQAIKPSVRHPGLIILWSDNNSDVIIEMRWKLFLTAICPTLKVFQWQYVDGDLLLAALSVYYLYNENYLNESEVDAVLATIATYPLYPQHRLRSLSYDFNFRAGHISVTLIRTYGVVLMLLAACGYPVTLTSNNAIPKFEGVLFQKKYADVMKDELNYKRNVLCEENDSCLKVFYTMRRKILKEEPRKRSFNRGGIKCTSK